MKYSEFKKYATMGIGVAKTMQKIELFEKVCEICKDEPKTAGAIALELTDNGYVYVDCTYREKIAPTRILTQIIAGMICSDQTDMKKFFEITNTPEKAILVTDPYDGSTYAVKSSVHLYKFIG